MRLPFFVLLVALSFSLFAPASSAADPFRQCRAWLDDIVAKRFVAVDVSRESLASPELRPNPNPWVDPPSYDSQVFPHYLGGTPRELALHLPHREGIALPAPMKARAEAQAQWLRQQLSAPQAQFETWPSVGGDGQLNWVFARWRRDEQSDWHWLTERDWRVAGAPVARPILPQRMDPRRPSDRSALFDDFLKFKSLYQLPVFGNAVWTKDRGKTVIGAWLPEHERETYEQSLVDSGVIAYVLPQPARDDHGPVALRLGVETGGKGRWEQPIRWENPAPLDPVPVHLPLHIRSWPEDFRKEYEEHVRELSGAKEAVFPISKKKVRFTRKNSSQPDHQLEELVDYLEEFYRKKGVHTIRQRFTWRGIPQSNLIAVIPGKHHDRPVVFADHIDAPFEEDTFARTGQRRSSPSASDNITATAALMGTADVLKDTQPENDIWLVHLTGEEYPADDLGMRKFLSEQLRKQQDLGAVIIPDFIGFKRKGSNYFQLSPAGTPGSNELAALAIDAAQQMVAPRFRPLLRRRNHEANGVYQTDVWTSERMGFPGLLANEHLNYNRDPRRTDPHNHQTIDTADNVNFDYASDISRVLIETVLRAANRKAGPR